MDKPQHDFENKLRNETSPYLLQHVNNPVAWYPWGEEAILRARNQDKPILLSIGYSSCHWCHVMMRESFCDADVAATMNRLFVNIMVDKEERPDLDKAYQTAYQLMMGQPGGWPLTLFVSPHTLLPYFGGTYFPKEAPEGAMGFVLLLHKLNEIYYHDKERLRQQEVHIAAVLQIMMQFRPASIAPIAKDLLHKAEVALAREFDPAHGGFGQETKFPNCPCLDFLLESPDTMNRHMALTTLQSMAEGGIYDQLDGGFFRYSVDDAWQIPHFEKMLYDNGQLIGIYANAYNITNNDLYKTITLETAAWLEHHLLDKTTDSFYTAFDADTEEREGLYYLWDLDKIKELLNDHEFASIKKYFHLNHKANFDHKWHLYINPQEKAPAMELLKGIKAKLLAQRETRIAPQLDTLILTGWNGLTIKGLSIAGKVLNDPHLLELADNSIKFFINKMYIDGRLYATWQAGSPKIKAFLDDYAFLLDAVLTFIGDDKEHPYIPFCQQLADDLLQHFYDSENGGFYFTANDAEPIFFRPKSYTDDSIPSGNGIACLALIKLGAMKNNEEYITAATRTVHAALAFLNEAPELHLNMCLAYSELQKE